MGLLLRGREVRGGGKWREAWGGRKRRRRERRGRGDKREHSIPSFGAFLML